MDKQQAQQIIRDTFESTFDKRAFTGFIKNFLNKIDEAPFTYKGNYIPDAFKQYIKTLERLGKFSDGENSIDILVITLQKETSLERARTMQRNFVAWYLNGSRGGEMKDAALAAFVSPNEVDWRFSLVKMDYKFEKTETGRMKVKEEFTPARRWSFLVGANEKSHTAQSRLVNILANDEQSPTLKEIEKAFDIETVTKEFFLKYRELFMRTKEELDRVVNNDPKIEADFKAKGVDTVNFSKKLLGQIVFLYFLQKKGWFGVGRDDDWGTGSKHFLREMHEKKHGDYNNFYNDILEPLFYEALRIDRSYDDDYYSRFNCKIPFLNGGLFDPIGNYDWVHTDIIIPDRLFSNTNKTREGDTGDGILDIFDRYNFTVKEDEPLEKEVAIDPELLGKSYEKFNAIRPDNFDEYKKALKSGKKGEENKFNKKFGVYYTPREIVHYMCRQSLINYLATELDGKANKDDIETLIYIGEYVSENEETALIKEQIIKDGKQKTSEYKLKLPESIRKYAELVDQKLAGIIICDPAVGSGAFPVGMMSEIVRVRNVLSTFVQDNNRTSYEFKRHCIEHSLYGVDIDPGAVEIAKLRLWLSLMVDEEDIKNIKPLPNLDYKVVCGNSLLGVEKDLFNLEPLNELEKLKPLFFSETNPTKKQEYKKQIDNLIILITKGHKEFDFNVYFSEVFHHKGGFDVVIANPPYVQIQKLDADVKFRLEKQDYNTFTKTADLYCLFYERGNAILRHSGILTFISSNKFLRSGYGTALRRFLNDQNELLEVIDFGELPVFDAGTDPCIILVKKRQPQSEKITAAIVKDVSEIHNVRLTMEKIGFELDRSSLNPNGWTLEHSGVMVLLDKIRSAGKPLGEYVKGRFYRGILTGFNEAFVIDRTTRDRLIAEDSKSVQIIKPWLRGKDIRRWYADYQDLYVIFTRQGIEISKFPAVKKHLEKYRDKLEPKPKNWSLNKPWIGRKAGSYKWFEIQDNIAYHEEFERPKIVYNETSKELHAFFDEDELHINKTGFIILSADAKYILGILNSRLMDYLYRCEFPSWGNPWQGGRVQFRGDRMENIPIVVATKKQRSEIETRVDKILMLKKNNTKSDVFDLEEEIDNIVYQIYGLSPEEIKIVEEKR